MSGLDLCAEAARIRARRRTIDALVATGGAVQMPGGWPGSPLVLVVHQDTAQHRAGAWRMTRFEVGENDSLEAIGHVESATYADAVTEAVIHWGGRPEKAVAL